MIVPSDPGGALDVLVRILGAKLTERWGYNVVSDLRAGAGGIIGSEIVAKAAPDGHTLLIAAGGYALNTVLYAKLPYDTFKDFERISLVAFGPSVLLAHPTLQAGSVRDLLALAKTKPGGLTYGSAGLGTYSYLSAELLWVMAGVSVLHIPYKGAGALANGVLVGEVSLSFSNPSASIPLVKDKRLRALGVTSKERMSLIPDVPAVAETVPGYEVQNFFGILAPARTPRPILQKLHAEVVRALSLPDVRERLTGLGYVPAGTTPEEYTAYVQAEIAKWSKAGIKPN